MENRHELNPELIDELIMEKLKLKFFTSFEKGLLRTDISEEELTSLNDIERYNLYYLTMLVAISVIPTVEMKDYLLENYSPDYDVCGGAGNLGFVLGIPTSDSHFRLTDDFRKRADELDKFEGVGVFRPDFSTCLNTEELTANAVARKKEVNTVIGSWILVQHPDRNVNEAIKILDKTEKNPRLINTLNLNKKMKNVMMTLMRKGLPGVPNGIHMPALLKEANLVFIGNHNIHHKKLVKELYSMYKHTTYNQEELPFLIIDKQWLRGNEGKGFIKYFPKTRSKK